jgi:hypothetical protein
MVTVCQRFEWNAGEEFCNPDAHPAASADYAVVETIPDGVKLATMLAVGLHRSAPLPGINFLSMNNCYS